jgi:hypothetical protein
MEAQQALLQNVAEGLTSTEASGGGESGTVQLAKAISMVNQPLTGQRVLQRNTRRHSGKTASNSRRKGCNNGQ